ncbi:MULTISPECIES: hypothetical protein [Chelativorans]|uniref:Transmembrane protein n=1 Tax=Chelativorans sp. (strain BNC1) TaxID=266779 RepID=Q11BP7_CHESB|nr:MULTISPECIES: hypothetical protein [Chelativorans]
MRLTANTLRFVLAYTLVGIAFLATLVLGYDFGIPGMLVFVPPMVASYGVLLALSRTPWLGDVAHGLQNAPSHLVSMTLAAIVLLWASSLTGFYEQVAAFNAGAPLTARLVIDVIAIGLLVAGAFVAGIALAHRGVPDMDVLHPFVAANMLLLAYTLATTAIAGLPAGPNPQIPAAALALMAIGYVRWAIRSRREAAHAARDARR